MVPFWGKGTLGREDRTEVRWDSTVFPQLPGQVPVCPASSLLCLVTTLKQPPET